MDNKQLLISLIEKYRNILHSNNDYIICEQVLRKVAGVILTYNSDNNRLELEPLCNLTDEELSVFSKERSLRSISAFKVLHGKQGWRVETVINMVESLKDDIVNNKFAKFIRKDKSLDELLNIVELGLYKDNSKLILDFIKISLDNKMLTVDEAIDLNFYILKQATVNQMEKKKNDISIINISENGLDEDSVREQLKEIFSKYGYTYDEKRLGIIDAKLVKYVNLDYVDYVLSKFSKYGINNVMLYSKIRGFYGIVIDNDKHAFDSILDFVDANGCSLSTLLSIPSVFIKESRAYASKNIMPGNEDDESIVIVGTHGYFMSNINLYKERMGIKKVSDEQLSRIGKFLCTPSSLVNKNLYLLEQYGIIEKGTLPKSIVSLCGKNTEFLIDRFIEVGLYDSYLRPRVTQSGEQKLPRGTCALDWDRSVVKFYKMKRANDIGDSILASNAGIKKIFRDNNEWYKGIGMKYDEDGKQVVSQTPLELDFMNGIDPKIRKGLPIHIKRKIESGEIDKSLVSSIYFNTLYKYKEFNPSIIFGSIDVLTAERVSLAFSRDCGRVTTFEEMDTIRHDSIIQLLDNGVYCDSKGNTKPIMFGTYRYVFSHPSVPNVSITISRYKVMRLCKLLKEDGCFINDNQSLDLQVNILLSVLVKDSILSEIEFIVLKKVAKELLSSKLIKVDSLSDDNKSSRGVR